MSGCIKRLLVFLLSVCLICVPVCAGQEKLCGSDEIVLLAVPGHEIMLYYGYDENGVSIGRIPAEGWGESAKLVRKDALFQADGDNNTLVRAGDLKPAAYYPPDQYALFFRGSYYLTLDKGAGILTMYDESTQAIGNMSLGRTFDQEAADRISLDIVEFPDSQLVTMTTGSGRSCFLFGKDGQSVREISDPQMLGFLNNDDMAVFSLGEFLVVCPYPYAADEMQGVVMTLDGTVVMDRIEAALTEYYYFEDSVWLDRDYFLGQDRAQAVIQNTGSSYAAFGPSLEYLGELDERPEYYGNAYGSGFIKGIAYPELNGNVCEGFILDVDTQSMIPYAEDWGMYLVWKDGRLIELPAEGTPERISSAYCVSSVGDGTNVYRIKDGSLFASYNRYRYGCVSLGSEGIMMHDDHDSEEWWDTSATIYDNEGNATYHSKDRFLFAFINGTWTCRRGVYRGLIDMYGNWVLKDTIDWEL